MKRTFLFLLTFVVSFVSTAQDKTAFPRSEWDCAKEILMHTPGEELFDGVIHPYAGLFEYYFDVDKAAQEHKGYIKALENNGIKVHTVRELLEQAPIERLRSCAMSALTYDTSNMTGTTAAESEEYRVSVIGEMSRADLIRCLLLRPTVKLYSAGNNTGFEAVYTHSPLMNLYFTRDQSITTPCGHIISKMNSVQRAAETEIVSLCYELLGVEPILTIAPRHIMAVGNQSRELQHAFAKHGVKVEWIPLETLIKGYGAAHCMTQVIKAVQANE